MDPYIGETKEPLIWWKFHPDLLFQLGGVGALIEVNKAKLY